MDRLFGRELTYAEVPEGIAIEKLETRDALVVRGNVFTCNRCNQKSKVFDSPCTCEFDSCFYCPECLNMGKLSRCSSLYSLPENNQFSTLQQPVLAWEGMLSDQQTSASKEVIQSIRNKETRLLWAVAGAGKTEMLFPGIEWALLNNLRVCIASPRVDVCLELAPRIKSAFPSIDQVLLYGNMEEKYRYTQLVICTTHQLLRFKNAFDVLIIDEIDAFPFHNDKVLNFAAKKSRKIESALIYLSATPDRRMQKQTKRGDLKVSILPARYHGHKLPEPYGVFDKKWKINLLTNPKKTKVFQKMEKLLKEEQRFLVFAPDIKWMIKFERVLTDYLPESTFEVVYASDPNRKEKVLKMRNQELDFLVTTTILERGVTFPNIDVLVIGAEDRTFTESSLVQISGRVGRSPKYPTGEVVFYHSGWTIEMRRAIKQIKMLNKLAFKRGLINGAR